MVFLVSIILCSTAQGAALKSYSGSHFKVGQNIYVQPDEIVNSGVTSIGGDIYINGTVNGSALCIGGNVYVNGTVKGNVRVIGGEILKGENGSIGGATNEIGKDFKLPSIFGNKSFSDISENYFRKGSFLSFVILFIFCLIVHAIMPKNITKMALNFNDDFGRNLLYGYGVFIGIAAVSIALVLTLIGILLVPLLFLVTYVIYIIGFTALVLYLGERVSYVIFNRNIGDCWSIFIGTALYHAVRSISVGGIGIVISTLFVIPLSIGIAVSTNFGTFRTWRKDNADTESQWDKYKKY